MIWVEQPLALACIFIWMGFVASISFLEAWLKFRAPGVTLPIGLGIGRLMFNALNKIEWVFALVVIASALLNYTALMAPQNGYMLVVVIILLAQTAWLLPKLDARAGLHISGLPVPPSNVHVYFIAAEVLKIILLAATGISMFKCP